MIQFCLSSCGSAVPEGDIITAEFTPTLCSTHEHRVGFLINVLCSPAQIPVLLCRVAQLERLSFKQQAALFAQSQVVIMTHGAALGNVLFMSPVSSSHRSAATMALLLSCYLVRSCCSHAANDASYCYVSFCILLRLCCWSVPAVITSLWHMASK